MIIDKLIAKKQRNILLLDFYSSLLTDRQVEVFTMSIEDDYSFAEIGIELGITPQAVADLLKRGMTQLEKYESKLGLIAKFEETKQTLAKIDTILAELEASNPQQINILRNHLQNLG